jgi:flagellar basal body-associated protein FliL
MRKLIILLILCTFMLLLGACSAKSPSISDLEETEVAIAQQTQEAPIVPVSLEPPVDNCIECHTDKQMLIDTAIEEEEDAHGAESEGVG